MLSESKPLKEMVWENVLIFESWGGGSFKHSVDQDERRNFANMIDVRDGNGLPNS